MGGWKKFVFILEIIKLYKVLYLIFLKFDGQNIVSSQRYSFFNLRADPLITIFYQIAKGTFFIRERMAHDVCEWTR